MRMIARPCEGSDHVLSLYATKIYILHLCASLQLKNILVFKP